MILQATGKAIRRTATITGCAAMLSKTNFFCLALLLLLLAAPARAAERTVTDPGDSGPNTLRGVIGSANNGDTIVFSPLVDTVSLVPANGESALARLDSPFRETPPHGPSLTAEEQEQARSFSIQTIKEADSISQTYTLKMWIILGPVSK